MWQPVFFHGSNAWLEKIAGGWSLSGIFNLHSGFPWTPMITSLTETPIADHAVTGRCSLSRSWAARAAALATTHSRRLRTRTFPRVARRISHRHLHTLLSSARHFPRPLVCIAIRSLSPGIRAWDLTLAKAFGLPKAPVLGENARVELRVDAYNLFNNLNLDPTRISNNVSDSNFGTIQAGLAARVVTLSARFSF